MRKSAILSFVLLFCLLSLLTGQQLKVSEAVRFDGVVTTQDLQPAGQTVHPVAARAMARGEKAGTFRNVRYELAPNVRILSPAQKSRIKLVQDGILDLTGGAFNPSPDSVYMDPSSDLVLQAAPVDNNEMMALRPSLSAVFQDIDVPEQEVPLTLANTVSMAEGVVESAMQMNNDYAVNLRFDSITYLLDKVDNDSLTVTLVGSIQLTNPRVEGKYSKNGGYRLVFLASEQVDMKVYTSMTLNEESKTPIWGTEIKMSDLGKCEIGLFILATMEGKLTLAVEIHQGVNVAMGAKGGTFWYIPTSIHNISTIDSWCDISYNVTSQMKAFVGFQCTANLKVKGYNALDVYVNGGMEGTVNTDGMTLDADVGLRLKAGGKVVSKKFTLLDSYYSLWKYQKPDYHGYDMMIHEACAWGDYVAGEVNSLNPSSSVPGGMDTIPYAGPLKVIVKHPDNSTGEFSVTTDNEGIFIARSVPLKKGDKVMIKLPGVGNPSPAVDATIPFKEVRLWSADYFTGVAEGSVSGSRSKWARLAAAQQGPSSSPSSSAVASAAVAHSAADRLVQVMPQQEIVKRLEEFKSNLTVYRGPISFITQNMPSATITGTKPQGGSSGTSGSALPAPKGTATPAAGVQNANTRAASTQASQVHNAATPGARVQAAAAQPSRAQAIAMAEKPKINGGTVNSPMGIFAINGLNFEPGQKVKARIVVEGFIVESDWIETDGLMVSAIEHDGLDTERHPGVETISAGNSFVVVSAVRGDMTPTGTVRMISGADAPHASITGSQPLPEFPEATRARVWFNMSAPLVPVEDNPGSAVASTGPWSATYNYMSPGDALIPDKNRKHPFEMVTYIFKDKDLGYYSFIDECASCTSPVNVIDRLGNMSKPGTADMTGSPDLQHKIKVPVKTQQLNKTTMIR
jgi:hypothetical protein